MWGANYPVDEEALSDIYCMTIHGWPDNPDPLAYLEFLLLLMGHQRAIATVEPFTARPTISAEQDTLISIQCSAIAS